MKFIPCIVMLKNGVQITVREATKKDAEALLRLSLQYLTEGPHLITSADEMTLTARQEKQWINTMNGRPNSLSLVVTATDKMIGTATLHGETRRKIMHNATLGMAVIKPWQGLGVGTALLRQTIQWAQGNRMLQTLWLSVFAGHQQAISLYKKWGFAETGRQEKFIKTNQGFEDLLWMRLSLNKDGE